MTLTSYVVYCNSFPTSLSDLTRATVQAILQTGSIDTFKMYIRSWLSHFENNSIASDCT